MTGARRGAALLTLVLGAWVAAQAPAWSQVETPPTQPMNLPAGMRPLMVQTVPPVAGARFAIDGQEFVADGDGVARTVITKSQREALAQDRDAHLAVLTPEVQLAPGSRAEFSGWHDRGYNFSRGDRSGDVRVAAFNVDYLTSLTFVDPAGHAVDASRLSSVELKSRAGGVVRMDASGPVWLRGTVVTSVGDDLEVRDVEHTVSEVSASGSNVVNRDQQRFFPSRAQSVSVRVLFYTVTFKARDAFYGFDTGSAIQLSYPDGEVRRFDMQGSTVTVSDLPRGSYVVKVIASGPKLSRPLSVSRDQTEDIAVLTWLDVGTLAGGLVLLAAALLLVGRVARRRQTRARRARRGPVPDADERVHEPAMS